VKAAALLDALTDVADVCAIDTGQHYDHALNGLLYAQLGVRAPDVFLDVGSADHATQTAAVMTRAAAAFAERRLDAVVVIGDTNSTLGGALAAAKLRLPVVHVEAGLRSDDLGMAEEINRRAVDAISTVLCAPSTAAAARLRCEGATGLVTCTGDVARDVLLRAERRAPAVAEIAGWPLTATAAYAFATLHRAELVDDARTLAHVVSALGALGLPVVLAAHPRTRGALDRLAVAARGALHVIPALGYLETVAAIRTAAVVVTDSGGVQREAYWLGVPCVTMRTATEWTETVACGANRLVAPLDAASALAAAVAAQASAARHWARDAYGDGDAAARVARAIATWQHGHIAA